MQTITKPVLEVAFDEPHTLKEVAKTFGISVRTLRRRMAEYNIKPMGKPFARGYIIQCKDGHKAASMGEARIDDFLFESNIYHEIHKKLQGIPCQVDFWLVDYDVGLEYAGVKDNPAYDERMKLKQYIYDQWKISIVWIYPDTPLDSIIGEIMRVQEEARRDQDQLLQKLLR